MHCTILSGHRKVAPLGLKGGAVSENSRSLVHRIDGRIEELAARAKTTLEVSVKQSPSSRLLVAASATHARQMTIVTELQQVLDEIVARSV